MDEASFAGGKGMRTGTFSTRGSMLQGVTDVIMVGPLGDDYISSANMANALCGGD